MPLAELELRAIVEEHVEVPGDDDAPLAMDSVQMVELIEDLEDRFGITVRPSEVRPEHFASLSSIALFVRERAGSEG